jgi:L-ascorbate metabolism protein UlaG (beta-lactamase superfamily)
MFEGMAIGARSRFGRWLHAVLAGLGTALAAGAAFAQCAPVSELPGKGRFAVSRPSIELVVALPKELPAAGSVELSFLGHASFLLRSNAGVTAITDYNDYIRMPVVADIITMNNAHSTHFSHAPDPAIRYVLRGWGEGKDFPEHNLTVKDMRVRNVLTNVRNWDTGGTRYGGNSVFIFEVAGLCIAHLGHLHHTLTEEHLKQIGPIDVALFPVDGAYTMIQERAVEVLDQLKPRIAIPMHYFNFGTLERFLDMVRNRYPVRRFEVPTVLLSRVTLPVRETWVLPGH